ncbi:MAG: GDP-L-fucose synthase [Myxococcales bacterium]|nr:GDP-L-fucose synthase [Myxococcales bacterium]
MTPASRVYVAGHRGLVGSAIVRALQARSYRSIITATRSELDLTRQAAVETLLDEQRPDVVIVAAARVGGILANNTYRAQFIGENLQIQCNLIDGAHRAGVERLLFLGSSCIYPRDCPQPMREEHLLTGPLEPTNEPYALAKIAGIKMCEAYNAQYRRRYASVMPTNLFGPGDNFDLETSHVLPALLRKFHEAKERGAPSVTLWGTGKPRREFLHVDDMADACVYLLEETDETSLVNIGVGKDISILELAQLIQRVVGYEGAIEHDLDKPDGTPRKLLDVSRLQRLGWRAKIELESGVRQTYRWFLKHAAER